MGIHNLKIVIMKHFVLIKTTLLGILLCSLITGCKSEDRYQIDGTIQGLTNGQIYIQKEKKSEAVIVTDGKFKITGDLQEPIEILLLRKTPDSIAGTIKDYFTIYLEPGKMNLILNYADFSNGKVTGSKTQEENDEYYLYYEKILLKHKKELDHYNEVQKKYKDAVTSRASEKELDAIKEEEYKAGEQLAPMSREFNEMTIDFIRNNSKSFISGILLFSSLPNLKYDEAKSYYDKLSSSYKNTKDGKKLATEIENMKKGAVGSTAESFNTKDINGEPLTLRDFKGKYLLIDFWASWCVPCRKGNPHLLKLYKQFQPKGLEILGVSDDDRTESGWRNAVEKDGIGVWRHVLRGLEYNEDTQEQINVEKDINTNYNIRSLPTKVLVNPSGIIVARYGEGEQDDKKLEEDLAAIFSAKK